MKVNQVGQQKRKMTRSGRETIYFFVPSNHGTNYIPHMCIFKYIIVLQYAKILHVSNGSIFFENELLFQKVNMVEHIIHCLGSLCPSILFCIDYDSTKQVFKVKSVLEDFITRS